ncbi:hypothetical protein J6590_031003 [Homalodisca vitripennis]|nr:hypothetical protein J6590_031003 [Homalodisca vitripennis]
MGHWAVRGSYQTEQGVRYGIRSMTELESVLHLDPKANVLDRSSTGTPKKDLKNESTP